MVVVVVANLTLLTILALSGLWKASAASTLANATTLAGCPEKCGNITVPYPFGTAPGCSKPGFNLTCDQTFRPPKLFLGSFEVTEISVEQALLHAVNPIVTYVGPYTLPADAIGDRYTLSAAHNVFTALDCGNMASLNGPDGLVFAISAAICPNETDVDKIIGNGSCSGIGCCQAADQIRTSYQIRQQLVLFKKLYFDASSKAFLVQKGRFNFSKSNYLYNYAGLNESTTMPFVVGWAAGKSTCEEASRNSTSFACRSSNRWPGLYLCVFTGVPRQSLSA